MKLDKLKCTGLLLYDTSQLNLCKLCKGNCQFVYLTDWNKDPLTWTNKLWPGWDATLLKNGVTEITSIGKFKALQLSKVVANFRFAKQHKCILQSQEVKNFQASKIPLVY